MSKQDIKCPICGCVNKGLYLDETDGCMECIKCRNVVRVRPTQKIKRLPVINMGERIPEKRSEKIEKDNRDNGVKIIRKNGFSYYEGNPSLFIHKLIKNILTQCRIL